ncbi:MAG: hypothetical protein A2287_04155 [Candidatus Melainabacteria bacterium RIFOXYA12_FULL_32_12]|nr:MAG: hypothetical protein A2287_04155 [Candidatus Melainabacteria bacterium RIFOXYA12_FULL_32_12]
MITAPKLMQKPYISFEGSLQVKCKDKSELDHLKKDFRQTFLKTNEELLDYQCDDVLIISPKQKTNNRFYVYTDRNPSRKIEINLENSTKNNVKKLVEFFKKLSSGKRNNDSPQTGDVVGFSELPLRGLINLLTCSKIAHMGIMCNNNFVLESNYPKSEIINLNDRLKLNRLNTLNIDRKVYVFRLNTEARKKVKKNRESFNTEVKNLTGINYNFKTLFHLAGKKLGVMNLPEAPSSSKKSRIICSELVGDILKKIRIIPDSINTLSIIPGELVELGIYSDLYERITRIK